MFRCHSLLPSGEDNETKEQKEERKEKKRTTTSNTKLIFIPDRWIPFILFLRSRVPFFPVSLSLSLFFSLFLLLYLYEKEDNASERWITNGRVFIENRRV